MRYAGGKGDDVTYEGEILGAPSASILLLGAFHFEDAGRDWYKPQHDVDILSASRQREIVEVVDRLAHYAPTKIAVERTPEQQGEIDEGYAAYLRGNLDRVADEIYQLGFRLAAQLGHRRVYGVNAWDRHYEPDLDLEVYAREHSQEDLLTEWSPRYQQLYEHDDRLLSRQSLRQYLLYLNAEERIIQGHGHYLVDWFKLGEDGDYTGPDVVTGWYNRNLRIFRNLQRITHMPDERILLIIGAGHLPILRHAAQASPEYGLVEVADYLDDATGGEI